MRFLQFIYIIIFTVFLHQTACSQVRLDAVDTTKIEFQSIVKYLHHQTENGIVTFADIQPSLKPEENIQNYNIIDREFLIKDSIDRVWDIYVNSGLQRVWSTRKIHYGFSYSRDEDRIYYRKDHVGGVVPGLIVYLNLDLLFGVKDLAMAFEVTKVDHQNKVIEFSYLKGNVTEGKQLLIFESTPKGYTLITHLSYYRSNIKTRDKVYPHVHATIINRFHRNMERIYKEKTGK